MSLCTRGSVATVGNTAPEGQPPAPNVSTHDLDIIRGWQQGHPFALLSNFVHTVGLSGPENCIVNGHSFHALLLFYSVTIAITAVLMTTQIQVKNCDGAYSCHPPKDCCKQGCCYPADLSVRPPTLPTGNMFNPLFIGHWYFWAAVTATLAGILCACSLWRRHNSNNLFCCRDSGRDERASEPDSNGSCYAPPQYSRCSSFHQAPPPYSEVTSKPDLYPLVISYNGDTGLKTNGSSTGYLMVQYFRNFIVRPVGSLSATSTVDSLSSSFICNASNEANTIIPPPYSCMGSLEELNSINNNPNPVTTVVPQLPNSASSLTCNDLQLPKRSPSIQSHVSVLNYPSPHVSVNPIMNNNNNNNNKFEQSTQNLVESSLARKTTTACFVQNSTNTVLTLPNNEVDKPSFLNSSRQPGQVICDGSFSNPIHKINKKLNFTVLSKDRSVDSHSESQEDEHNFSDLLNLSVCAPSSVIHLSNGMQSNAMQDLHQSYSVANSMTSSDISSLANLGTPDSPPRATSPTIEMRELLDKIQQLPQQKSPVPETPHHHQQPKMKAYFNKAKAKTLYMPLQEGPNTNQNKISPKTSINNGLFSRSTRSWLSRSAPNTPCSNFVPSFSVQKKHSGSQRGSKIKINDGSPLLNAHDESDEEPQKDECL